MHALCLVKGCTNRLSTQTCMAGYFAGFPYIDAKCKPNVIYYYLFIIIIIFHDQTK